LGKAHAGRGSFLSEASKTLDACPKNWIRLWQRWGEDAAGYGIDVQTELSKVVCIITKRG